MIRFVIPSLRGISFAISNDEDVWRTHEFADQDFGKTKQMGFLAEPRNDSVTRVRFALGIATSADFPSGVNRSAKASIPSLEVALLALILALAAFLRLYRLDLIDVRFDEASALQLALGIARGHLLPVAPFSGSVANHPPVYLYLMALPYLFTRDFMTVAAFRVLLDVLAIALCWWLCRRFFNLRVAILACVLFAVAPWAIQFARKVWLAPVPLFSVILLFGLLEALQRRNPWGWAIVGGGLALCVGAHLSAVYLVPVVVIALIIGWRTLRLVPVLIGLALISVMALVYLGFDAQQGLANVRGLLGAAGGEARWSLDALNFALWGSGGAHLSDLTSSAYPVWEMQVPTLLNEIDSLQIVWLAASVVGLLALIVLRPKTPWRAAIAVLLLWLMLPVALQLRHSRPLQMHYFAPLYPVPFIVMALGVDALFRRQASLRSLSSIAVAALILLIVGWQTFTTLRFAAFIEQHDTSNGGYGPPIRSALDVTQLARDAVRDGRAHDVIVAAPGGDPAVNEPATVFDVLLADVPHRFANADAGIILREDAAQYIFTPGTSRAQAVLMDNADASGVVTRTIAVRAGNDNAYGYAFVPRAKLSPLRARPAQWASGVGLLGYSVMMIDVLTLNVSVRVFREAQAGEDFHWFAQLYRGEKQVAHKDTGGVQPSNWRVGDILLLWFDLSQPPVDVQPNDVILLGAYHYPQIQNVDVVDAAGNAVGQAVSLSNLP